MNSDWGYGVHDGGDGVGTGDKSINEDALPRAFIVIPSAKKKWRVISISRIYSKFLNNILVF